MFRHSKYSAPMGRGKKGAKLKAGGSVTYQGANQDTVSPEKLQQLIKTFQGDYPRINIAPMYGRDQVWGDQPVKRRSGGLIDRPYSPGTLPWPRKSRFFLADGGKPAPPAPSSWGFSDDLPSRPGFRKQVFTNQNASGPLNEYPKEVTRGEWKANSGPFRNPSIDFPLNVARNEFESNPFTTGVVMAPPVNNLLGKAEGVNPTYQMAQRTQEYRDFNPTFGAHSAQVQAPAFNPTAPKRLPPMFSMPKMEANYNPYPGATGRLGDQMSDSNQTEKRRLDKLYRHGKGGTIHINPANKGKFTATKKATGKTTAELTHSSNPLTRKRAVFAQNARKWHHARGGRFSLPGASAWKGGVSHG